MPAQFRQNNETPRHLALSRVRGISHTISFAFGLYNLLRRKRSITVLMMSLRSLHTSSTHAISPDSQDTCGRHQSYVPRGSTGPLSRVLVPEDDYGECDVSLQSYNCYFDPCAMLTHSLHNLNELLWKSLDEFRRNKSLVSLGADGGVYALQAGRETRIEVRMREDAQMVHISAVVHSVTQLGNKTSNNVGRGGAYSMLMTIMRFNSKLSETSSGGRIFACNDQVLFFQDVPIAVLKENGMLHRKLEEFILKTVEISRGFDRNTTEDHNSLCHRKAQ